MLENPMVLGVSRSHRPGNPITCWNGGEPVEWDNPEHATCAGASCRVHFEDGDEVRHCPICEQYFCENCWNHDRDICSGCDAEGLAKCQMCGKTYKRAEGDDHWCAACIKKYDDGDEPQINDDPDVHCPHCGRLLACDESECGCDVD